jgi:hypothetical protein
VWSSTYIDARVYSKRGTYIVTSICHCNQTVIDLTASDPLETRVDTRLHTRSVWTYTVAILFDGAKSRFARRYITAFS